MTALDLAALRRVADKATQEEWCAVLLDDFTDCTYVDPIDFLFKGDQPGYSQEEIHANAVHIATFNPPTALALLSRIEALEAACLAAYRLTNHAGSPQVQDANEILMDILTPVEDSPELS